MSSKKNKYNDDGWNEDYAYISRKNNHSHSSLSYVEEEEEFPRKPEKKKKPFKKFRKRDEDED